MFQGALITLTHVSLGVAAQTASFRNVQTLRIPLKFYHNILYCVLPSRTIALSDYFVQRQESLKLNKLNRTDHPPRQPCRPLHCSPSSRVWRELLPIGIVYESVLLFHLFWTSGLWTHQPGSHTRRVTQDFSTFLLRCLPSLFSREGFSRPFPSSTVKSNFVFPRINRSSLVGMIYFIFLIYFL